MFPFVFRYLHGKLAHRSTASFACVMVLSGVIVVMK